MTDDATLSEVRFDDADNPYPGPRPFRAGEILDGRERELIDLYDILIAQRILLLYAASGAGKSSLVEAALRPALTSNGFIVLPTMRVGHEPPVDGIRVNRYRTSALLSLDEGGARPDGAAPVDPAATTLGDYLTEIEHRVVAERDASRAPNVCLVFDQFEELFTIDPTDVDAKLAFVDEVGSALAAPNRWALFSMREDFIAHLDPYLSLIPKRLSTRYRLDLLGPAAAVAAIQGPARRLGVQVTSEAAEHLVDDLRRVRVRRDGKDEFVPGPYVEPVQLQVVCRRLWNSIRR